jgi:hypothetical protein
MKNRYETVSEFQDDLLRREQLKKDIIAPTKKLVLSKDRLIVNDDFAVNLNKTAHQQIATWAKIPMNYYDRAAAVPGLRELNVNSWFNDSDDKRLIRSIGDQGRAFLSDRFKTIDHMLIMNATMPVFQKYPDMVPTAIDMTDDRMYFQGRFPSLTGSVVGDAVQVGFCLTNSEVGKGNFNIELMIWRLVCMNGMVTSSILKQRHVGRRVGGEVEDYAIYKDDTIRAELESYRLRVRDAMDDSLSDESVENLLSNLNRKAEQPVEQPIAAIENVTKKYSLTEDEKESLMNEYMQLGHPNRWGITNAITATAQKVDADRAYDLEKLGNEIAFMPNDDFKNLVAA